MANEYNARGEIKAAGGIVLADVDGRTATVLVHRPRYDDWSLPKGKVRHDERDEDAALREVEEETGLACELGADAGTLHYFDRKRRAKAVRLWLMRPVQGSFSPSDEVDRVVWLDLDTAATRATRSGEREFLTRLGARLGSAGPPRPDADPGEPIDVYES